MIRRFTFLFAALPAVLSAAELLSAVDEAFLRAQIRRIVDSAALGPGQLSGKWLNSTPYRIHVPGGNMGYPAFWVRDAVMMLGGDLISAPELEDWIRLISSTVPGPDDWQVRPGVVVPAFAIPDHVNFNGKPTFYPGNLETGSKQGGAPWGKYPPLDDHFYFITAVYEHWKLTRGLELFNSSVATSFSNMKLADLLERVFHVAPCDAATGLVVAGDIETENAKDFGFCDAVSKSGKLLFTSTLAYIAANQLADLFAAARDAGKARFYRGQAARIKQSIVPAFFHASAKRGEGWLHSATGVGNQPDVWGSAFALWSGAVDGETARQVSRALVRGYREKSTVREGAVRHLPAASEYGNWQRSVAKPGEYQNGGYWGAATGWYIAAMHCTDRRAAADMARDYVQWLRTDLRPDGLAQAWEWFNPDTGKRNNPLYVASVALPYLGLKRAGLLGAH